MSHRVMSVLATCAPDIEVYSIDEAFLWIETDDPLAVAAAIRQKVMKWTGIPVSVGVGATKTLAKLANDLAKKDKAGSGVCALLEEAKINALFRRLAVKEVWGIGPRLSAALEAAGIQHLLALTQSDDDWIKKRFSVTVLKTVWELRGLLLPSINPVASCAPISHLFPLFWCAYYYFMGPSRGIGHLHSSCSRDIAFGRTPSFVYHSVFDDLSPSHSFL